MLLKVYANCIDGEEEQINVRIEAALQTGFADGRLGTLLERPSDASGESARQVWDGAGQNSDPVHVSAGGRR